MSRYFDWAVSLKRFVRFDTARSEDLNDALDELTAGLDDLDLDVNRSIKLPSGTADQTLALGSGARANKVLAFDGSGNITVSVNDVDTTAVNAATSTAAAAAAALSESNAATSESNASASASSASASATSASGSASTATTQAGIATTQAGIATTQAGIATAGGDTATTQAGIATTQASTATTQAGLADTARIAAQAAQAAAEAVVATIPEGTINDATTSLTDVWSSTKVSTELAAKVASTNGTASGLTLSDGYTEEVFAVTGTTPALSPANGSIQTWTLSGASTPTYGTWAEGQSMILMVTAGANTITWPTTSWSKVGGGGAAPSLTASGATCVILWKVGVTTYGALLGSV